MGGRVPGRGDAGTWIVGCGIAFSFNFSRFRSNFFSNFFNASRPFSVSILFCREATSPLVSYGEVPSSSESSSDSRDDESGLEGRESVVKLFRRGLGEAGIQDVRRGGVPITFPGDVQATIIAYLL